ncbi:precorrin-6A/cobalt-precorrin-6A reductase, partial [Nocardia wallacei]|uniref:precorrin-6A/cobalt-precorrin-6A reductase n=1 Tax=Nocardia wallacei TaxID=480035 RepID=UPI003CC7E1BB
MRPHPRRADRRRHRPAGGGRPVADRRGPGLLRGAVVLKVLILGGTREARELAEITTGERGFEIVSSLAGRVRAPVLPAGAVRIGGFGGIDGLRNWLADNDIHAVVDATHPFAGTMSGHAAAAAPAARGPRGAQRPPRGRAAPGGRWAPGPVAGLADRLEGRDNEHTVRHAHMVVRVRESDHHRRTDI